MITVLGNDSDPNGDPLTVTTVSDPANGGTVINPDGTVTYTPDKDFNGTDSFTYTISDGNGGTDTATVTVTVIPVNDAPVAINDSGLPGRRHRWWLPSLINDWDADTDLLVVSSVGMAANGTVVINNPDGTVTYTPAAGFTGIDTFTYTVSDGNGSTTTATVTIAVGVANAAPTYTSDPANTSQRVEIGGTLRPLTASDPDGDTYTFSLTAGALPPGVTLNPDGTFSGTPTSTGTFVATISVCDSTGLCSNGVLSIQVVGPGELPFTGVDSGLLAIVAAIMTGFGTALVAVSRRRRRQGV